MSQDLIQEAQDSLSAIIIKLSTKGYNAFVTSILFNLEKKFNSTDEKPVIIKGLTLHINPKTFMELSQEQRTFSVYKNAWHIIYNDFLRGQTKEEEPWDTACNIYNNLQIKREETEHSVTVPDDAIVDNNFRGKEKEEIYQYLLQQQQDQQDQNQQGNNGDSDQGDADPYSGSMQPEDDNDSDGNQEENDGNGEDNQNSGSTPQPKELTEQSHQDLMEIAAMQADAATGEQAGNGVPDFLRNKLNKLYNPKLPWDQILLKYMTAYSGKNDYSIQKFNKHFFPHGWILPSLHSESMGTVVIAVDESCSVTDKEFEAYHGAIKDIKDKLNPEEIRVINFNTTVTSDLSVTEDEDISKVQFRGHGGTHIPTVFDHIEKNKIKPEVMIVFSDMYSDMPNRRPQYDTIWVSVNNPSPDNIPFGRTICIKV